MLFQLPSVLACIVDHSGFFQNWVDCVLVSVPLRVELYSFESLLIGLRLGLPCGSAHLV